jgi:uncharacterized protein YcbK (DUF882 family)
MGDLSENFSREEFACKCNCGMDTVDVELVAVLEHLRSAFIGDTAITINSGCRCRGHNADINGSANSQHVKSRAADITVEGVDPDVVQDVFDGLFPDQYGMGSYDTFTHVDSRAGKARWTG